MAAVTDLATPADAVAAGYSKIQNVRAPSQGALKASQPAQFSTRFEKMMLGAGNDGPCVCLVEGESNASAASADSAALASLNAWRRARYGGSAGRASGSSDSPSPSGGVHVLDVT